MVASFKIPQVIGSPRRREKLRDSITFSHPLPHEKSALHAAGMAVPGQAESSLSAAPIGGGLPGLIPDVPMGHGTSIETETNSVKSLDGRCFQPNVPAPDPHLRASHENVPGIQTPTGPPDPLLDEIGFVPAVNPPCVSANTGPEGCASQEPRLDFGSLSTEMLPSMYSHPSGQRPMHGMEDWNMNIIGGQPPHDMATRPRALLKRCFGCLEHKTPDDFPFKMSNSADRDEHCNLCHARAVAHSLQHTHFILTSSSAMTKVCGRCRIPKQLTEFHRDSNKSDGLRGRCKGCESDTGAARRASKPGVTAPTVASKRCRRCGLEKPAVDFPRKKERSDGLDSYCKACNCAATSERTQRKGPVLEPLVASKVCGKCKLEKPARDFPPRKFSTTDGLYSYCRECKKKLSYEARRPVGTLEDPAAGNPHA